MQRYLTTFAMSGTPEAEGYETFSLYSQNDTVSLINFLGLESQERDPAATAACEFWAEAPYYVTGSA